MISGYSARLRRCTSQNERLDVLSPNRTQNAGDLLTELNTIKGPSCTEAALRVAGLSMAGWNVIASLILAAIAFSGARSAKA